MFELLFRYPAADFRAGEWILASGWPAWSLAVALGAAAALFALLFARARRRFSAAQALLIGGLELGAALWVLVLLWRPALAVERLESARNVVALLLDTSRSMSFAEDGSSRLELAQRALETAPLRALAERFDLRLYAFSDALQEISSLRDVPPLGEHTRLGAALREVLDSAQSVPLSAVVLVSDGSGQDGADLGPLFAEIERAGVPIHAVGVGRETLPEDLELADVSVPGAALPGARIDAQVVIRHGGPGKARLRVVEGDALLAARTIELDPARRSQLESISFEAGRAGVRDLRFSLEPLPGEQITGNNAQSRVVDVAGRPRRVLYVEGEPRWEYAFVRRAVERDRALELVGMLSTTERKRYRQGVSAPDELESGFPTDREALFAYDALILGSVEAASLSPAQQGLIRDFVGERGGGLLMLAGRSGLGDGGWGATAVQDVLPVRLPGAPAAANPSVGGAAGPGAAALPRERSGASFERRAAAVRITAPGLVSPIVQLDPDPERNRTLWSELPAIADYQRVGEVKPGALALLEVLVDGRPSPLLTVQRYGRGRAAVLATGGTWRWQMRLPRDDGRFETFWRQLLRFLAASSPASVSASVVAEPASATAAGSAAARESDVARVRVEVQNAAREAVDGAEVSLRVVPESGPVQQLEPRRVGEAGVYEAEFAAEPDRMYRVEVSARAGGNELGSQELHFRHAPDQTEDFHPEQDRALLERIAAASGGAYWTLDRVGALPEAIRNSGLGVRRREILELWFIPVNLLLLLLLKGSAWALRRRFGGV